MHPCNVCICNRRQALGSTPPGGSASSSLIAAPGALANRPNLSPSLPPSLSLSLSLSLLATELSNFKKRISSESSN